MLLRSSSDATEAVWTPGLVALTPQFEVYREEM